MADFNKYFSSGSIKLKAPGFETESFKPEEITEQLFKQIDENIIGINTELTTIEKIDETMDELTFYWKGARDFGDYITERLENIYQNSLLIQDVDVNMAGWKLKIDYQLIDYIDLNAERRVLDIQFLEKNKTLQTSFTQIDEGPQVKDALKLNEYFNLSVFDWADLRFMDSFTRPGIDSFVRTVKQTKHDFVFNEELSDETYQLYSLIRDNDKSPEEIQETFIETDMKFVAVDLSDYLAIIDEYHIDELLKNINRR